MDTVRAPHSENRVKIAVQKTTAWLEDVHGMGGDKPRRTRDQSTMR